MKKFIFYLFLTFFISNYSFSEVSVEDNVSLFGIKLGDTLENYKTTYRHYSDPTCEGVAVYFIPDDCYKPGLKGSITFFSPVDPPIKNDEYGDYSINALFYSKKINSIQATSKKLWKPDELILCQRRTEKILNLIADKYEQKEWELTEGPVIRILKRGASKFTIMVTCHEYDPVNSPNHKQILLQIYFLAKTSVLDKEREMYIKSIEGKIDTKGF